MPVACNVEMKLQIKRQIMVLGLMQAMMQVHEGARAESMPIWMPSESRSAKLHSAYNVMVKPHIEGHQHLQVQVHCKFVLNQFGCKQLRDMHNLRVGMPGR